MHILPSVRHQELRCPRCGNRSFPDEAFTQPFICPVIGCGESIDPAHLPPVHPDPERCPAAASQSRPQGSEGDPLIYDRDANGDWVVKAVYGSPEEVTVPAMAGGRVIMSVAPRAFLGQRRLRSVTLPDTVAVIGEEAFAGCTALERISFGAGLTLLEAGVLRGCTALREASLPEHLQEIGREAFAGCTALEAISLGGSIRCIRDEAFAMCISLQSLRCRRAPESIAVTAFSGCDSLDPEAEASLLPDNP